ncbi:guanine nucleotide-binding protein alpha-4 subunit [Amanita muscaria]
MPVVATSRRNFYNDDPLDAILRPPPDESPQARQLRLAQEEEARRVSLAIDATLKTERLASRKKRIVRLLLLGQSESGKSTTLRQFQRLYTPTAFREERILWRAVIQLNIVRSIRIILDAISAGYRSGSPSSSPYPSPTPKSRVPRSSEYPNGKVGESSTVPLRETSRDEFNIDSDSELSGLRHERFSTLGMPPHLEALKAHLLPLRHIEALLIAKLVPPDEEEATRLMSPNQTIYPPTAAAQTYPPLPHHITHHHRQHSHSTQHSRDQEVFVRANHEWKGALARGGVYNSSMSDDSNRSAGKRPSSLEDIEADEAQQVLRACRDDMLQLWHDENVRDILCGKKIRLEESPGFFLNDLDRVTSLRYVPSDDDVLKARLKTVGVAEYRFTMEVTVGRDYGAEWRIIDVGGTRSQRPTWMPFFDDADAIIFLAPISGFDQVLVEDRSVNRLEDSVLIWKDVCSNKLLANVDLILFLNKCDILEAKLNAGVRLAKYVRSYGDRENDFNTASKYLRSKFSAIHREYSPSPRKFYAFCTSVTDTSTTTGIIASVRDMVVRRNLKQSKML